MARASLDMELRPGRPEMPACLLVHGVGMTRHMWSDPEQARVMGGLFPIRVMLTGHDERETLFHDLARAGLTVLTWSQRRPVGPASAAIRELVQAVDGLKKVPHRGLILLGHSRGGLLARAALSVKGFPPEDEEIMGLITICSPHEGSELSRWAGAVGRLTSVLNHSLDKSDDKNSARAAIKRMLEFLESKGVMELLPGSEFLRSLPSSAPEGAYCLSVGGTDPALLSIPGVFSFPSSLEKLMPKKIYPDEMAEGRGDGLVSARSARLPFAHEHLDFHLNHAAVAVDTQARREVMKRIRKHCLNAGH